MKVSYPYKVRVVVDPEFGERLASFPAGEPVWVIDTPANKRIVTRLRAERRSDSHLIGITTFTPGLGLSPVDEAIAQLDTIELHHGEYSAAPPYSIIEIFGCGDSQRLRSALAEFGFHSQSSSSESIIAVRAP